MIKRVRAKRLRGFWEKTKGLIGKKKETSVIFETRFGIHTFGLKSPIDVLILNSQNKVVKLCPNLLPNRIMLWNPIHKTVLELPKGTIKKKGIREKIALKLSIN